MVPMYFPNRVRTSASWGFNTLSPGHKIHVTDKKIRLIIKSAGFFPSSIMIPPTIAPMIART